MQFSVVLLAVLCMFVIGGQAATVSAGIIANGYYYITNTDVDLTLDVYNWGTADGVPVTTEIIDSNGGNQAFYATHLGNNYYTFMNYYSNKYIDISYIGDLATVQQRTYNASATRQQWLVAYDSTNNGYTLTNKASGYVIMAEMCNSDHGFLAVMYAYNAYCQFWRFSTPSFV